MREIYAQKGPSFSVEFFPPKTPEGESKLLNTIENLRPLKPSFFSVTYGAAGSTQDKTLEWVKRLKAAGFEVMCHLTVIGQSKRVVRGILKELRDGRIENIIALRGDPPRGESNFKPHPDGFQTSLELIREAAEMKCFSIAVSGFPEVHPEAKSREDSLRYLKKKVDCGADCIITQLFFDNENFYRFVEDARRMNITLPIVPGILPIKSAEQVRRFAALCGARIPPALSAKLSKVEKDDEAAISLGIEVATRQCEGLIQFGAPGIHFYSLNEWRSVSSILKTLGLS